ncbi:flavin-containing monooxygenase [Actinomycetes bacterium M1A6_2h]
MLIVGAGFAGMALAARTLKKDPDADLLVIDKGHDVGGTWRDNTYPGAACDVPTVLYSFSFAPHAEWSHTFARGPEIYAYLRKVADDFGIREHLVTDCELLGAQWDDDAQQWNVTTSVGEMTAKILVAATGTLSTPSLPDVPGRDTFTGSMFHSATWDHDVELRGKRIAVVGTGASAVQFVPEIADDAEHLFVFQRTPAWVIPRMDRTRGALERFAYRRLPITQKLMRGLNYSYREVYVEMMAKRPALLEVAHRIAQVHMRRQVSDRSLRKQLTPDFVIGCKRMLLSNDWLRTLDRPDVDLIPSRLTAMTENAVVDAGGREYPVDAVIFGTGFTPTEPPVAHLLTGRDGRTLAQRWAGSPSAFRGTTISGFPNLFMMYGPNTNLSHSSIVYMLESQSAYIESAVETMAASGIASVEVTESAQRRYNDDLDDQLEGTVWNTGGCSSWYLDASGRNSAMWPSFTWQFRNQTKRFDLENYKTRTARKAVTV